jgi:hypothetical protein
MQNTMPDHRRVYSPSERRIAVWVLVAALALAALSGLLRAMMPPSLGSWDGGGALPAPPGVVEARPLTPPTEALA